MQLTGLLKGTHYPRVEPYPRVNQNVFNSRFLNGDYIGPYEWEAIKDSGEPWQKPVLPHEEYKWLETNHPEYTQAYQKGMSPLEERITSAAIKTGFCAAYAGIGYGVYKVIIEPLF